MSKRRRNRPSGTKHAQPEAQLIVPKNLRANGELTTVGASPVLSRSRLACSGELIPPAPLPEPAVVIPCEATQKSVMIEPRASIESLAAALEAQSPPMDEPPAEAASERAEMDSFPPLVSAEPDEPKDEYPPEVIARRMRARKIVGALIGAAALFFAFGVGKSAFASRATMAHAAASQPKAEVARVQAVVGKSVDGLARSAGDVVQQVPATPPAAPVAAVASPDSAAPQVDPAEGAKLRKEAESLLNRGRYKESIEVSRAAIAADPLQATSYLLLGTALQSTGKWKDGIEAYSECVRKATRGPVHECSAVGGHK